MNLKELRKIVKDYHEKKEFICLENLEVKKNKYEKHGYYIEFTTEATFCECELQYYFDFKDILMKEHGFGWVHIYFNPKIKNGLKIDIDLLYEDDEDGS